MTAELREQQLGTLRWLVLRGPAAEAFTRLGQYMRAEIREIIAGSPLLDGLHRHVSSTRGRQLLTAVRQATEIRFPSARAELASLAAGAEVPFGELALMSFWGDLGRLSPPGDADNPGTGDAAGCSDLAWRRERSYLAHNEDGGIFSQGRCVMLTLALGDQQPVTTFWKPGMLPGNTISFSGSGLVWSIDHLTAGVPGAGAGRHFVARSLQCNARTLDEALGCLARYPSAGGYAYNIGDQAGHLVSVESSAGQLACREVGDDGPLTWHTNHGRYISGADANPGGNSLQRGAVLDTLTLPASEPDPAWFAGVLAGAPPPTGVRADGTDAGQTVTLCTFVVDLTARLAFIAPRGADAVSIPLDDLVRGNPHSQRATPLGAGKKPAPPRP